MDDCYIVYINDNYRYMCEATLRLLGTSLSVGGEGIEVCALVQDGLADWAGNATVGACCFGLAERQAFVSYIV